MVDAAANRIQRAISNAEMTVLLLMIKVNGQWVCVYVCKCTRVGLFVYVDAFGRLCLRSELFMWWAAVSSVVKTLQSILMIGCWGDGQEDDDERDIQRFFRLSRPHESNH